MLTNGIAIPIMLIGMVAGLHDTTGGHYVNEFVIETIGGPTEARRVADELGFIYKEEHGSLDNHYLLYHKEVPKRHKRRADVHANRLSDHPKVVWSEQQFARIREKRGTLSKQLTVADRANEVKAYTILAHSFNDPMWNNSLQDWYMVDRAKTPPGDRKSVKTDLGVLPAWQKGYTGKGVVVSILDDGLEWNHTDIQENYSPEASYDLNDDDDDPFPRYDFTNENSHGTRCAGVIAMVANNNYCGVGIAPHAKVGGVRVLDGAVTDLVESRAISFNVENIDIMSASWGPTDNGMMVDGPSPLGAKAFEKGIAKGRHGRGMIYVWASGNGGTRGDNCECDGYVSSPYSISISATSTMMVSPYYVEYCPSTMATTFSSGGFSEGQIVSADLHNGCTQYFTGTSAAAPQAAGVIALVLEANPYLGWRDVQHLIAWTASPYALYNNPGWKTNAAGFKVNHRFGFGLLNAIDMVEAAETWKNVGTRLKCEIEVTQDLPSVISRQQQVNIHIRVDQSDCDINYLEHVELVMTATYSKRGDLSVDLTSAQGTQVSMMRPRENDFDSIGYQAWPFMSVQTWGENPHGDWVLKVWDDQSKADDDHKGEVQKVTLRLFGTHDMPPIAKKAAHHRRYYNYQLQNVVKKKYPDAAGSGGPVSWIDGIAKLFNGK